VTARTLTLGSTSYPLFLPNIRDPRLHVASVVITIHVLGQIGLHFRVSVPQILAAIITCAVIEVALTFRSSRAFVWPASAMLTGSGVALILRVVGTPPDQPWNTDDWYVFAVVAGASLLTKYVIKYRGTHVFNPSNIGLVAAFVLLGSTRVEPLDFWWAPITDPFMVLAYAVIIVGGLLITRRLHLLALAAAFWLTLTVTVGLLAGSGHCMVANWAFTPICGADFWRVIVTSPEVLIFLFFMITDPKTTPGGQVGRVLFGILVAVTSTLLMAPQTNEFGTKVGLLAGLVVICAARPILDRLVPEPKSTADDLGRFGRRLVLGRAAGLGAARVAARAGVIALVVLVTGAGIVGAGTPARGAVADTSEMLTRVVANVDPGTLPAISVATEVTDFDHELTGAGMQQVVVTLGQNLAIECEALLDRDAALLTAVDHGDRLDQMRAKLQTATADGTTVIERYRFDTLDVSLLRPFGRQDGLSLGFKATGTTTEETYDASGALIGTRDTPLAQTFVMRRATGDRWLNVAVLP
jgi:Na+-translocating ferredoxin:NAD+ oxidoreductase RnfD subunit